MLWSVYLNPEARTTQSDIMTQIEKKKESEMHDIYLFPIHTKLVHFQCVYHGRPVMSL